MRVRLSLSQRRWDVVCLVLALGLAAYICWKNAILASRIVDGQHWFYLDDDMMISMRYGRNLAEGHGLVWNPGERVEGYTNFLWTMVMAGVHKLGAQDRTASLWMRVVGFVLLGGSLAQMLRVLRALSPRSLLAPPVMFLATLFCADVMWWSAWGFETSLLTFLFLTFVASVLHDPKSIVAWVALSLVPLTRADGLHLFLSCAVVGLVLVPERKDALVRAALAAVPVVLHLAFRRVYYGEWFPNTYFLKVYLLEDPGERGFVYARSFVFTYPIPLALAAAGAVAIARRDRRALLFFLLVGGTLAYVSRTGGDMMGNFRFCAHLMPLVFVFAAAGIAHVVQHRAGRWAWATALLVATVPLQKPLERVIAFDGNGDPREQIVVASLVNKNALPDASIGVIAAGIVPYFTRRYAVDVLGKSDKHVARLKPWPGAMVGHGKLDPAYSLGARRPDLVVSCRNLHYASQLKAGNRNHDPVYSFLSSYAFIDLYRPFPIHEDFTTGTTALYTHAGSREAQRRHWKSVGVGSWPPPAPWP
ncbi:MAG: hypothetical protein KIT84_12705 [Labilithrix sp.]|nr:hypothetical protein [Labilithrix sp.]MCW5811875.1 hypothetical protein [Labilithrix sp.]